MLLQGLFFKTYEKCKTVIRTELKQSRDIHVCPRMVSVMHSVFSALGLCVVCCADWSVGCSV